jgi:hypothetical protein
MFDILLSTSGFKSNLRRYTKGERVRRMRAEAARDAVVARAHGEAARSGAMRDRMLTHVGRLRRRAAQAAALGRWSRGVAQRRGEAAAAAATTAEAATRDAVADKAMVRSDVALDVLRVRAKQLRHAAAAAAVCQRQFAAGRSARRGAALSAWAAAALVAVPRAHRRWARVAGALISSLGGGGGGGGASQQVCHLLEERVASKPPLASKAAALLGGSPSNRSGGRQAGAAAWPLAPFLSSAGAAGASAGGSGAAGAGAIVRSGGDWQTLPATSSTRI